MTTPPGSDKPADVPETIPLFKRYEVRALTMLEHADDLLHDTEGSFDLNVKRALAYATQAVALTNLALLNKDEVEE